MRIEDLAPGDRVEMAVHTDAWMRGDRYATVTRVGAKHVWLRFERSQSISRLHPVVIERKAPAVEVAEPEPEEEPMDYVFQPGDSCDYEGENVVHDSRCGTFESGTLTSRKTGAVVGKKEI